MSKSRMKILLYVNYTEIKIKKKKRTKILIRKEISFTTVFFKLQGHDPLQYFSKRMLLTFYMRIFSIYDKMINNIPGL